MRTLTWRPPTDVYETEESIIVRVEVAGMRDEDFTVKLDGRYLTVRGLRADLSEKRAYYQMEIRFGEFSSEVELVVPVVMNQVEATYSNGFLNVILPKMRAVQINASQGVAPGNI